MTANSFGGDSTALIVGAVAVAGIGAAAAVIVIALLVAWRIRKPQKT